VELQEGQRILRQCPYALSGGMNQRVALALAMLLEQEILLCDEPTSALDATIGLQVAKELKKLRDDNGITQIIVTHNLALARFLADRIGVMYAGRLVELGEASDMLHHPQHPYTRSLMAAIPRLNGRMPEGLPGQPPLTGPAELGCEFADRCPLASQRCAGRSYELAQVHEGHFAACCQGKGGAL
jgi:oligopeptide/dipeptide ABC transporter ATP-binding protein